MHRLDFWVKGYLLSKVETQAFVAGCLVKERSHSPKNIIGKIAMFDTETILIVIALASHRWYIVAVQISGAKLQLTR